MTMMEAFVIMVSVVGVLIVFLFATRAREFGDLSAPICVVILVGGMTCICFGLKLEVDQDRRYADFAVPPGEYRVVSVEYPVRRGGLGELTLRLSPLGSGEEWSLAMPAEDFERLGLESNSKAVLVLPEGSAGRDWRVKKMYH